MSVTATTIAVTSSARSVAEIARSVTSMAAHHPGARAGDGYFTAGADVRRMQSATLSCSAWSSASTA
jgi:hypothetical protein